VKHLFFLFFVTVLSVTLSAQGKIFEYGVASGDPQQNSVVLWTKVSPKKKVEKTTVKWKVSTDRKMSNIIAEGIDTSYKSDDFTLSTLAKNLPADTWLYYQFESFNELSDVGRTKTAPLDNSKPVHFAVVSCSRFEHGYYNVYKEIVDNNSVEAVLHLGDYIYEYSSSYDGEFAEGRYTRPEKEVISLTDYRTRYAHYRKDSNLRKLHQNFPTLHIWDDHEVANNSCTNSALNHDPDVEGDYIDRINAAKKAFFEWLPVMSNEDCSIYRKINYGKDINLIFLDTRLEERDEPSSRKKKFVSDTSRRMIGDKQFSWLTKQLSTDTNTWNILAQQVIFSPLKFMWVTANPDQWDGYLYERNRICDYISQNDIRNLVVLTGDAHSSWANDIPMKGYRKRSGKNSLGVEFVTPSVTSDRAIPKYIFSGGVRLFNKHIKYLDLNIRGYIHLTIKEDEMVNQFKYVNTVKKPSYEAFDGPTFNVKKGERHLNKVKEYTTPKGNNPQLIK